MTTFAALQFWGQGDAPTAAPGVGNVLIEDNFTTVNAGVGLSGGGSGSEVMLDIENPEKTCPSGQVMQTFDLSNEDEPGCVATTTQTLDPTKACSVGQTIQSFDLSGTGEPICVSGSGSSVWSKTGTTVYYNGGNVGVGTSSPIQKLDVAGKVKGVELCIGEDCRGTWPTGSSVWSRAGTTAYYNDGNVGIGKMNPTEKLDVAGSVKGTKLCIGEDCRDEWPTGGTGETASFWTAGGDGIYYNGGGVGIGSAPSISFINNLQFKKNFLEITPEAGYKMAMGQAKQ